MSLKLTKLYTTSQLMVVQLKSFNKSLSKNDVILKTFLEFCMKMIKTLAEMLETRQELDEIYGRTKKKK